MSDSKVVVQGPGLLTLLFLVFLVLKLCNVINWSWWWVTIPLWGPLVLFLILVVVAVLFIGIARAFAQHRY